MKSQNYSTTFIVDETPEEAFAAINNVRDWWSGNIEGSTNKLGYEWTYRYKDIHYSKQKITELIPGKRVVWHVLDCYSILSKTRPSGMTQRSPLTSLRRVTRQKSDSPTWD